MNQIFFWGASHIYKKYNNVVNIEFAIFPISDYWKFYLKYFFQQFSVILSTILQPQFFLISYWPANFGLVMTVITLFTSMFIKKGTCTPFPFALMMVAIYTIETGLQLYNLAGFYCICRNYFIEVLSIEEVLISL